MKYLFIVATIIITQSSIYAQKNFIDQPYIEASASVDTLIVPDKIYISIKLNETDSKNKKSVESWNK